MPIQASIAVQNANIITLNSLQPRADALAIREGSIVAVGAWDEVSPYAEGARVLDLAGLTVLPGFIDTHVHVLLTALSLAALDVSDARDHPELQGIVSRAAEKTRPGEIILGVGFTEYARDSARLSPIIAALDDVAPLNPVYLVGVTGQMSAANTRALELLALSDDVAGILRDAHGQPNGLLVDAANSLAAQEFIRAFAAGDKTEEKLALAVETALSAGLTTVHALEGGMKGSDAAVSQFLTAMSSFPLRFVLYYQTMDVDRVVELGLRHIGGCILLDGDVTERTAALSEPYADDPECCGTLYYTQGEIDAFALNAHRAGLQIALHAVGDAAVEQALNAYEAALSVHPRADHRHRIEHCEVIRDDQIQRAKRLGVALAIQPPFNFYWPHTDYLPSLGPERAWKINPVRTLVRQGLLVGGGSDSTVTPLGPLTGVHAAVNHSNPAERVSVHEALQLYTINAARLGFQAHDRGSLETGKLGDLVVLAEDPYVTDPRAIKDIPVVMTIIGGQVVYQAEQ
jgi:predicted amidohydrolase YtcJ